MACAELMVTLALDRRFWVARKDSDGVKVPKDTWRFRKDGAAGEQRPAAAQAARYFSELRYARRLSAAIIPARGAAARAGRSRTHPWADTRRALYRHGKLNRLGFWGWFRCRTRWRS